MGHDRHHVSLLGPLLQGLQRGQLAGMRLDLAGEAALLHAGAQDPVHRGQVATPQVVALLADDDVVRTRAGQLAQVAQDLIGPVTRGAQRQPHLATAAATTRARDQLPRHVQQALQAGLVMGKVDQHQRAAPFVEVESSGVGARVQREGAQPSRDPAGGETQRVAGGGCGQRVGNVIGGEAAEGDRQLGHRRDRPGATAAQQRHHAVAQDGGPSATLQRLAHAWAVRLQAEGVPAGARLAPHGPYPRIVRVEHRPAASARDAHDGRLHLRQLVQGVDPLQAKMVGRDVGHHRHVVGRIADAAQQDPAACRLEHGQLQARLRQDATGTAEAGPIARLHELVADVDAVRVGHPHPPAGLPRDVRDQARGGALAVGAGDRHHRHMRRGQVRPRTGGNGAQGTQLPALGGDAQRHARGGGAHRLGDRATVPLEGDRRPLAVGRVAHGEAWRAQVEARRTGAERSPRRQWRPRRRRPAHRLRTRA